tara:strand:- start:191 stop:391 length:201 start_codon:yes stop_codon:yes gene_type:complete
MFADFTVATVIAFSTDNDNSILSGPGLVVSVEELDVSVIFGNIVAIILCFLVSSFNYFATLKYNVI